MLGLVDGINEKPMFRVKLLWSNLKDAETGCNMCVLVHELAGSI
jgi:hypothetical protein